LDALSSLRWVSDADPGLRRVRRGRGFAYLDARGRPVRDPELLQRIRRLAIPPAYQDVWICPDRDGHLQATGRDARGRKQYRYHPDWRTLRDATKFDRMRDFGLSLPNIRRRVRRQLDASTGVTQERIVAALVRLLDTTWLRIGNAQYTRDNGSFGLSTVHKRHVEPRAGEIRLSFVGKGGVRQQAQLNDRRVARLVRRCQELPGQTLFRYCAADGSVRAVESMHVNAWLADAAGMHVTAKDFRTWHGSVLALALTLDALARIDAEPRVRRAEPSPAQAVIAEVARRLGNTPAVCRKSYIHPAVLELLRSGEGAGAREVAVMRRMRQPPAMPGLSIDERRLLALIAASRRDPR
jgi:DNA topoisomerase-1